jgi:hypothetical protein
VFLTFLSLFYYIFFKSDLFVNTEKASGYFHRDGKYCGLTRTAEPQPGHYSELQAYKLKYDRLPPSPENFGIAPLIDFSAIFDRKFCESDAMKETGIQIEITGKRASSDEALGHSLSNVSIFEVLYFDVLK